MKPYLAVAVAVTTVGLIMSGCGEDSEPAAAPQTVTVIERTVTAEAPVEETTEAPSTEEQSASPEESSGGTASEKIRVPNVVGKNHQLAQDTLQAAGLYALENNVTRLADDHRRAQQLGATLARQPYVAEVLPVETNLVIFRLQPEMPAEQFLARLEEHGIKASAFGPQMIRFVTHLDVDDTMLQRLEVALTTTEPALATPR